MTATEALALLNSLVSQMPLTRVQHAQAQQAVVVLQALLAKSVPGDTIAEDSPEKDK